MVRRAIESLYSGKCTIVQVGQEVIDPITKVTSFEDVTLCENEPCRLSYQSKGNANITDTVTVVNQTIKLFIRPELVVLAGARVVITQNGKTRAYKSSGESAVYSNHQEIVLEIEDDKA